MPLLLPTVLPLALALLREVRYVRKRGAFAAWARREAEAAGLGAAAPPLASG